MHCRRLAARQIYADNLASVGYYYKTKLLFVVKLAELNLLKSSDLTGLRKQ
jgi:hypothetical protein